jgi:hypothetical protein
MSSSADSKAVGLTVESTPGHYRVLRDGEPVRKANGMPFTLPFSPDTIRWRRPALVELRNARHPPVAPGRNVEARRPCGHRASTAKRSHGRLHLSSRTASRTGTSWRRGRSDASASAAAQRRPRLSFW